MESRCVADLVSDPAVQAALMSKAAAPGAGLPGSNLPAGSAPALAPAATAPSKGKLKEEVDYADMLKLPPLKYQPPTSSSLPSTSPSTATAVPPVAGKAAASGPAGARAVSQSATTASAALPAPAGSATHHSGGSTSGGLATTWTAADLDTPGGVFHGEGNALLHTLDVSSNPGLGAHGVQQIVELVLKDRGMSVLRHNDGSCTLKLDDAAATASPAAASAASGASAGGAHLPPAPPTGSTAQHVTTTSAHMPSHTSASALRTVLAVNCMPRTPTGRLAEFAVVFEEHEVKDASHAQQACVASLAEQLAPHGFSLVLRL
ncbi:MAG: hypothetical protein EOO41_00430 [Methanobacteriota archaeon]|nr:MAG: hypothetical protein EOO41_00430 [Euryarchaeota archaeon]